MIANKDVTIKALRINEDVFLIILQNIAHFQKGKFEHLYSALGLTGITPQWIAVPLVFHKIRLS